jgi:hypothetical protein
MTSTHYSQIQNRDLSLDRQGAAVPIPTGHYIGLDLGQAHDHTAIAVLERSEICLGRSPVTFERIIETRYSFRHLERLPLGMDYPSMVDQVRTLLQRPELAQSPTNLVVDATGLGRPVVDLLRRAWEQVACYEFPVLLCALCALCATRFFLCLN